MFRKQFELVGGPVAVVEGAGGAEFIGIAGGGDVVEVEEGAALEDAADGGEVAGGDFGGGAFDGTEKGGVLDGGDFDGFGDAVEQERQREGVEEVGVVEDGPGWGEGAEEILGARKVDGVFDADAGVALGEGGGGDADEADSAVEEGGGESGGIEEGAAADGDAEGVAADGPGLQGLDHAADGPGRLLDGFAAGQGQGGAHEIQGVSLKLGADLPGEIRKGREDALVEKDQAAVAARGGFACDGVAQGGVARRK